MRKRNFEMPDEPDSDPQSIKPTKSAKKGKGTKSTRAKAAPLNSTAKGTPWTFPKVSLEDAIQIPKAIEEKSAGNPTPASVVAEAVGFKPNDWRFKDLLRAANQYGLVTGSGETAIVHLTPLGQDIVAPSEPQQRSAALLKAFSTVELFDGVQKFYGDKRIPEDEFFLNTLTREFAVPRDRAEVFSRIFLDNVKYLRAFYPSALLKGDSATLAGEGSVIKPTPPDKVPSPLGPPDARVREYLDTCFVMMPFGSWFDRYYKEIYVPAIKDAGLEPVRADELFTTGSVVEQIWEQIEKSKLLLADLSGKNANVFYEMGLAHAASKPVVFTSSDVADVPFDLRHLRVIIYDIREPEWASRLRQSITEYLRNAAKEPEKSIPHPFRKEIGLEAQPIRSGRRAAKD
jgi:hypothetical protein